MKTENYEFDTINIEKNNNFVVQSVSGRKLSGIYHSHDFYEIIVIGKGECESIINGERHTLQEDCFQFLKPGDCHSFISQSEDIHVISVSVRKEEFESLLNYYDSSLKGRLRASEKPILCSKHGIYRTLCNVCADAVSSGEEYECKFLLSCLIRLYISVADRNKEDIPNSLSYAMRQMQKYENLKSGIEAFTKLSGYSHSHLARLVKKHLGVTVHEYILNLRLSAAYNELILSRESIENIGEKLGYCSLSHFNKIFKKKYGITPAMLRRKHGSWTT